MDLSELLRMLQRRWLTIVVLTVISLSVGAAVTFSMQPKYESTTRIFISTNSSGGNSYTEAVYSSMFAAQRVASYGQLATSRELLQRVIDQLKLDMTPSQLASKITSSIGDQTVIITVSVTDTSPAVAQDIAKAHSAEFTEFLAEVETPRGENASAVKATVVDPASYNAQQVSPRTMLNLMTAGVLGLILGIAIALLREILDKRVSSAKDVEEAAGAPILAAFGYDADVPKHPLLSELSRGAPRVEAFRLLRTNLQFLDPDGPPTSIVITSALPEEGKTSIAVNLAVSLSQVGMRVLLVDGDLRRPKAAEVLGLERSVGFTTVLVGRSELTESIQRHQESGVFVLASGPIPPNPTEILQSKASKDLLDRLRGMFDMVVIDAPPLLPVSDAAILARDVDGAILVARHGRTTVDQLKIATQRLEAVGAELLGAAVNMTPKRGSQAYGYSYGYDYDYQPHPTGNGASKKAKKAKTKEGARRA